MLIVYQLINFTLLAFILWLFGRKMVGKMFQGRQKRIADDLMQMAAGHALHEHFDGQIAQVRQQHEQELEQIRLKADARFEAKYAQLEQEERDVAQEREAKLEETLVNARRSMLKRVKRSVLLQMNEVTPDQLHAAPEYADRMAQSIVRAMEPTQADRMHLMHHGTLPVHLLSAEPVSQEDRLLLADGLRASFPTANWPQGGFLHVKVDPALVGGLKLVVNDTVYDGTVRTIIDNMASGMALRSPNPNSGLPEIRAALHEVTDQLSADISIYQTGRVESVSDGICVVSGLSDALYGELLRFPSGIQGIVMDLDKDRIGCAVFGEFERIDEGVEVRRTGRVIEVPVGDELLGRVLDGLGQPIDGSGEMPYTESRPVECPAPTIIERQAVKVPLYTGVKAVDALVPIGRGQRELIIGDRQTGKTALAVDTIINQRGKDVICIYVAVGQKETTVANVADVLRRHDALSYTIIVAANAYQTAPMQYLAPYTGTAMAEYFMRNGKDVLIVYDDLSKHAVAYRELSLLLHRPSGREAYPGDVFYLHSRLLERSARLTPEAGGGSITALPIIETQEGDIAAYIPTNVISITDGQIFLESDLFNNGQRPAVNVGLSVSRVGGSAQTGPMRQVGGRLRMELAQYRELASFSQFGSDLDANTKASLARGDRMMAVLKQAQYQPVPVSHQVLLLQTVTQGFADDVDPKDIPAFEEGMIDAFQKHHPDMLERLGQDEKLSAEELKALTEAIAQSKEALQ